MQRHSKIGSLARKTTEGHVTSIQTSFKEETRRCETLEAARIRENASELQNGYREEPNLPDYDAKLCLPTEERCHQQ